MKILHVLVNYHPSIGGTQILFKGISENLVKEYNDEVEVVTVDSFFGSHSNQFKKIPLPFEKINGVLVNRFPFFRNHRQLIIKLNKIYRKAFGTSLSLFDRYITGPWSPALKLAVDTTDADIIAGSSNSYLFMEYPLYRHRIQNPKPFVYQGAIHFSDNENDHVIADITLNAIKASEYYISNTEYEKDRLIKLGVPADMIVVIGTAVDMQQFSAANESHFRALLNLNDDNILVGYIGRLEATKSIDVLLYAFDKAFQQNQQLHLVIAGFKYDYVNKLEQIVNSFSDTCKNNIHFVFDVSTEDKAKLYQAIDIFATPSTNESFGIVFLEAWSCKKPVIGTAIGAIKSVISDGVDGLLMKPNSIGSLTEKILLLSNNKNLRIEFGENGYMKTKQNFTWEVVTKKYRDTYLLAIEKFNAKQKTCSVN